VKVAALEIPASFDRVADNLELTSALLSHGPCDLALLPEASLTGYLSPGQEFDLARFAEDRGGPTLRALAELAKRHRTNLVGPWIERDGTRIYNAMIGFDRGGRELLHYRKRHPWYPETWATSGERPHPVIAIEGARITIAICFDIHFAHELPAADVLLFPSAWVEPSAGGGARETDVRADLFSRVAMTIVNANWGVGNPRVPGQGASRIVGPSGVLLATNLFRSRADGHDASRLDATVPVET
jgi:5-aminopentanamidase